MSMIIQIHMQFPRLSMSKICTSVMVRNHTLTKLGASFFKGKSDAIRIIKYKEIMIHDSTRKNFKLELKIYHLPN